MEKDKILKEVWSIMDEYQEQRASLEKVYEERLRSVCVPYAKSIARFNVGDILSSGMLIMKVERIGAKIVNNDIITVYRGPMLTKRLSIRKDSPDGGTQLFDTGEFEIIKIK